MGKPVYIGLDIGTTLLKAAAFDGATGRLLASDARPIPVCEAPGGVREQAPTTLRRRLFAALDTLRQALGRRWTDVAGLGLAAQGGSGILADRRTGHARTPMLLWNDLRGADSLAPIAAQRPRRFWRGLSLWDGPAAGLGRIAWFRQNAPRLFDSDTLYIGAGEYAFFQLTGVWRQDAGNAIQIGCYDIRRHRIDPRPLALVGATPDRVAPMRRGHERHPLSPRAARRLGLSTEVEVAGPYMDHEAGYLAAAGASRRPFQVSLGTAWVGNRLTADLRSIPAGGVPLLLPSPVGPGWLLVHALPFGNLAWDWALDRLVARGRRRAYQRVDAIFRERLLTRRGLAALPRFTAPNPLRPDQAGAGGFFGIDPATPTDDLVRAIAASMVFEFERVQRPVIQKRRVDSLILSGGASHAYAFQALFALVFPDVPLRRAVDAMHGPRGTLAAFSPRVAQAETVPIEPPAKVDRADLAAARDTARALADRIH